MFDIIDGRGENAFGDRNDAVRRILGFETVIDPDDADNWDINVGKNAHRRANDRERPKTKDHDSEHDYGVRLLLVRA